MSAFPPDPIPKAAIWLALCCFVVIVGIPLAVIAGWVA